MSVIFNRYLNLLPLVLAILGGAASVGAVGVVWYYFSPEYTDVGYAPEQPVPYSHKLHVGELGLDCRYCHTGVEDNRKALIPSTQICMNCHHMVLTEGSGAASERLAPVRESYTTGDPIEWVRIHDLPDYVAFNHAAHVDAGVGCASCHGQVDEMVVVEQSEPLSMSWCLDCHRSPEEFIRPSDQVTNMQYEHDEEVARQLIESKKINPPENCSACHY